MNITELSPKQLRKAANIQEKIQDLQNELGKLLGAPAEAGPVAKGPRKRRMSAAGRAAIAAAARARWAKIKGAVKPAKKARRKMSAAAKARLSAMAKARWKKAKAAGKTTL